MGVKLGLSRYEKDSDTDIREQTVEGNAGIGRVDVTGDEEICKTKTIMVCTPCLPVHTERDPVRVPRPVQTFRRKRKSLAPTGNLTIPP
jgi:hypothetical protein